MKVLFRIIVIASLTLCDAFGQSQAKDAQQPAASVPARESSNKDPHKVAPQAYKLDFENEWVRVTRVHYGPREKIPEHYHTERASAYVYLNDSGPVIFKHVNLPYGNITRPPTKTGSFRLYRGLKELHAVENTTDIPSDFLRVEFKTEPVNENSLRGKFYRESYPPGENFLKVQFENEQVRISRLVIAPGRSLDVSANTAEPALLVALIASQLEATNANGRTRVNLQMGKTRWLAAGYREEISNRGNAPVELLRFEFKTKPFNDPSDRTDKHSHTHASPR